MPCAALAGPQVEPDCATGQAAALTSGGVCLLQDQYPAYQVEPHVPQHGPKYEHKSVPFDATTTNQVWVNTALCLFVTSSMLLP